MVAAERDFAVREMREMAEQCQSVAEEFQSMADDSERLVKEISEVGISLFNSLSFSASLTQLFSFYSFVVNETVQ